MLKSVHPLTSHTSLQMREKFSSWTKKNQQTKYHILDSLLKVDICEIDQFHSRQSAMLLSIFTSNRNINGDHVMRFL